MIVRLYAVATTVTAFVLAVSTLFAQQATVRVEGTIKDEVTGKPVGCKLDVFNAQNKKIVSLESNSSDGTYLIVVNEAGTMRVVLRGHSVYRKETTLVIPATTKFTDIKQNFTVRALIEGTPVASGIFFEKNAATLNAKGRAEVDAIKKSIIENGEMRIVFTIAPDEDQLVGAKAAVQAQYDKELDAWKKAVKKLKKNQVAPPEPVRPADPTDPNPDLVRQRIASLKSYLSDVKNVDARVEFREAPLVVTHTLTTKTVEAVADVPTKKGKKAKSQAPAKSSTPAVAPATAQTHPNLTAVIGKVKRLFD
ncbi:MAG: hypothetical protein MUC47_10865 [Candidatus Kapabacteria bacterium]|nr:hypothetical protein [Candidatus Kapabacteria bacterium]